MTNRSKRGLSLIGALLIVAPQARSQIDLQTVECRAAVIGSGAVRVTDGTRLVQGTVGQSGIGRTVVESANASIGFWQSVPGAKASTRTDEHPTTGSDPISLQAMPNPFSGSTRLTLRIPHDVSASLVLYNLLGQPVRDLLEAGQPGKGEPGEEIILDMNAGDLPSGRYTLILTGGNEQRTIPLLLVR